MTEKEIKTYFSRNVRELRISKNLNQIQLGEKLHYTSKAISKWENGDVLPDIVTLSMIAEFFNITVDDLISNKNVIRKSNRKKNHLFITITSCLLSFFLAAIAFLVLSLCNVPYAWWAFIIALPVSATTLVVLATLWFKKWTKIISIIILVWASALLAMVIMHFESFWMLLIGAGILSIMTVIFFNIRFGHTKTSDEE